jgi:hypothetical protein
MGIYGIVFKTQGGIKQGKNNQQQLGPQHNTMGNTMTPTRAGETTKRKWTNQTTTI